MPTEEWTATSCLGLVEEFELGPWASGVLSGLSLLVQETVDIEERLTGCGHPEWLVDRPVSAANAVVLDTMLFSGAQCLGRSRTDELGFSLTGESAFFGTPVNAAAPDRIPGGAASGAASAVSCKLFDLALVTDCGGSTVVPASNCGLVGWRASWGSVPQAGLLPVSPLFDSVGLLARKLDPIKKAAQVILTGHTVSTDSTPPKRLVVLDDLWHQTDKEAQKSCEQALKKVAAEHGLKLEHITLQEICPGDDSDLHAWYQIYTLILYMEILNTFGTWLENKKPMLGQEAKMFFFQARRTDRSALPGLLGRRGRLARALNNILSNAVLCFPTTPQSAPKKGFIAGPQDSGDYYTQLLSSTAISALSGASQVSVPLATHKGAPLGVSFIGAPGNDAVLLDWLAASGGEI